MILRGCIIDFLSASQRCLRPQPKVVSSLPRRPEGAAGRRLSGSPTSASHPANRRAARRNAEAVDQRRASWKVNVTVSWPCTTVTSCSVSLMSIRAPNGSPPEVGRVGEVRVEARREVVRQSAVGLQVRPADLVGHRKSPATRTGGGCVASGTLRRGTPRSGEWVWFPVYGSGGGNATPLSEGGVSRRDRRPAWRRPHGSPP